MDTFLFEVDQELPALRPFGPLLSPGVRADVPGLKVGASLVLRRPDGTRIETHIRSFPLIRRGEPSRGLLTLELPKSLLGEPIPVGTQVWLTTD